MSDDRITTMLAEDRELRFTSFVHDDAIALGTRIVALARERGQTISTAIWLGEQLVFQTSLAGTSADNDGWMRRKAAVVRRFDAASQLVAAQLAASGAEDPTRARMVDPMLYAFNGGAVPIRIGATQVGVVVTSGVSDQVEHDLVVEALRAQLQQG